MKKRFNIDIDTDDLDEIKEYIENFIEDLKDHCKNYNRHHKCCHGKGQGRKKCSK